jgi:hypothetical protein
MSSRDCGGIGQGGQRASSQLADQRCSRRARPLRSDSDSLLRGSRGAANSRIGRASSPAPECALQSQSRSRPRG